MANLFSVARHSVRHRQLTKFGKCTLRGHESRVTYFTNERCNYGVISFGWKRESSCKGRHSPEGRAVTSVAEPVNSVEQSRRS